MYKDYKAVLGNFHLQLWEPLTQTVYAYLTGSFELMAR